METDLPLGKGSIDFFLASLIVGSAFSAYKQVLTVRTFLIFIIFAFITLNIREIGQKIAAEFMEAETSLKLSSQGSITTIMMAIFSYISSFNIILLLPIYSTFSSINYEHWGKSIDAMWAKRKYWLAASGITALITGWLISFSLNFSNLAEMISLFLFFQLLPLDDHKKISGKLDGAYILLWSGFSWLIFIGISIILMLISVI